MEVVSMLQARLQDGKMLTPAVIQKEELRKLKARKVLFYCPVCGEKVILRAGEKVIPHFAHTAQANCPSTSGGEGPYHEQGKLLLYQWLTKQKIEVELELYIPEIKQRPDFLIHINGKRIALEYQCSKIPNQQIIDRTDGYKQIGIHVIWILGEKLLKRKSKHRIQTDSFTQTLIHQFSTSYPQSLFYFCPQTLKFIKVQDLSFLGNNFIAGNFTILPLKNMTIVDLFSSAIFSKSSLVLIWRQEKQRFRLRPRGKLYGAELQWHQWLYLKGIHFQQLPAFIHLPVKGAHLMKSASWNWQSRLVFDLIHTIKLRNEFSFYQCVRLLRKNINNEKNYPLIQSKHHPIMEYLQMLTHLGILEQTSMYTFKKIKSIHTHQQIDSALEEDEQIIKNIFSKNQTKYEHDESLFRYTK